MNRMQQVLLGTAVAGIIFLLMAMSIQEATPWNRAPIGNAESVPGITEGAFTTHLMAFEVLGVLLTAAMVGALVIARPFHQSVDDAVKASHGHAAAFMAPEASTMLEEEE